MEGFLTNGKFGADFLVVVCTNAEGVLALGSGDCDGFFQSFFALEYFVKRKSKRKQNTATQNMGDDSQLKRNPTYLTP